VKTTQGGKNVEEIDAIFQRLNEDDDIGGIRNDIADLISQYLHEMQETLGYWEKLYFAGAIAALSANKAVQPTPIWLRLCLVNLEKAFVPASPDREATQKAQARDNKAVRGGT
jgi:hypothetical protein